MERGTRIRLPGHVRSGRTQAWCINQEQPLPMTFWRGQYNSMAGLSWLEIELAFALAMQWRRGTIEAEERDRAWRRFQELRDAKLRVLQLEAPDFETAALSKQQRFMWEMPCIARSA